MGFKVFFQEFLIPKIKFGLASSVATLVDYGLYIALTTIWLVGESYSHAISYTIAVVINFLLQKKFIFNANRKIGYVFTLSILFSLIGWMLSQVVFNFLIYYFDFFKSYDLLAKVTTTATVFLYNFYSERFSFENKLPWRK